MNRYIVSWQTKPSPGIHFYQGTQAIYGWDTQEAEENALKEVNRKLFPERRSTAHLVATKINQIPN